MEITNRIITDRKEDLSDFSNLYRKYYVLLCLIAEHIVRNRPDAEEVVSDVFIRLWNCRERIKITTSLKAYLIRSVQNTALNYLEKNKNDRLTDSISISDYKILAWDSDYPLGHIYEEEIMTLLDEGIKSLPCACREIFMLSRKENMKYCEIAEMLGITVNTVKTQVKIALGILRVHLKDYISLLLLVYLSGK